MANGLTIGIHIPADRGAEHQLFGAPASNSAGPTSSPERTVLFSGRQTGSGAPVSRTAPTDESNDKFVWTRQNPTQSRVLIRLLSNPNLCGADLALVCRSKNPVVRQLAVSHRHLSIESLQHLQADSPKTKLADEASHRLLFVARHSEHAELFLARDVAFLEFVCQAPVLSQPLQKGLIKNGSRRIHRALAVRPDLGPEEVTYLASSTDRLTCGKVFGATIRADVSERSNVARDMTTHRQRCRRP